MYQKNNEIRISYSFAEASEKEIENMISQSPVQRLKNAIELILRAYGTTRERLQMKRGDNKIKIKRDADIC